MSLKEFNIWLAYRHKNGPMNDIRRYDRPAALITSALSQVHGGKARQEDFMPWGKEPDQIATFDDLVNHMVKTAGGAQGGKSR